MLIAPGSQLLFVGDFIADCGRVFNQGTSGHPVRDLRGRWDQDGLARRPD